MHVEGIPDGATAMSRAVALPAAIAARLVLEGEIRASGARMPPTLPELDRLVDDHGVPARLQCDNGSEFISKVLDRWAYEHGVVMDFSRAGKPTDNALVESFNDTLRDECLNINWFLSMEDARGKIERWPVDYNEFRPQSSLGDLTSQQFAEQNTTRPQRQESLLLAGAA
jgi:putative transposase